MFELTFLGTAASMPSAERGVSGLLVGAGRDRFLVDCGEGTQRQLLRAESGFRRLEHVLLTHAHLDHVLGLAGLIATLGLLDLKTGLTICGSEQTLALVGRYLAGLWPQGRAPVPVNFAVLRPGPVLEGGDYRITAFAVRHRDTESLGYRFETSPRRHLLAERLAAFGVPAGKLRARLAAGEAIVLADGRRIEPAMVEAPPGPGTSLAVVGDCEETEALVTPVGGADALVIEATFLDSDAPLAAERGHLTAGQAGRLAATAGVGALYLTHISGRYKPGEVEAEARRFFPESRVVSDFDRIAVARGPRANPSR